MSPPYIGSWWQLGSSLAKTLMRKFGKKKGFPIAYPIVQRARRINKKILKAVRRKRGGSWRLKR